MKVLRRLQLWLVVSAANLQCVERNFRPVDVPMPDGNGLDVEVADADVLDVSPLPDMPLDQPDDGPDGDASDVDVPDMGDASTDADVPDADVPDADVLDADVLDADVLDADVLDADVLEADAFDADAPDGATCPIGSAPADGGCAVIAAPRLRSPLSATTVTSQRPTLRWVLPPGADGANVRVCRDRACTLVEFGFDAPGDSARPPMLAPGLYFWQVTGRQGSARGTEVSATWEFTVGRRSAPVDTSWGATLDINGDGYADVAVGAWRSLSPDRGQVFLYYGRATGIDLASPDQVLVGPESEGSFGWSVASAGDFDGDGYSDLAVGATLRGPTFTGRAYLYRGGPSGPVTLTPTATLLATALTPTPTSRQFAYALASAGDVNGDGYADLVVGSYADEQVYLYHGRAAIEATLSTASQTLTAPRAGGYFGRAVAGAGDVDGDGFGDVLVGAPSINMAYLYRGGATGTSLTPSVTYDEGANAAFGYAIAAAGDVNGDGYADVAIGAYGAVSTAGRLFVYRGGRVPETTPLPMVEGPDGPGGAFGTSVSAAGDFDGDGYDDLVVSAGSASSNRGRVYVYRGSALSVMTPSAATFESPAGPSGYFGGLVRGVGDLDRNGYPDLVIGASARGGAVGMAFAYLQRAGGAMVTASTMGRSPGTAPGDWFGFSIAGGTGTSAQ